MSELNKFEQQMSRFLSLVLRHDPSAAGVTLDPEGWVAIDDLLHGCEAKGKPIGRQLLNYIVENNDKKRFTISKDGKRIRAAQGHSLESVKIQYAAIEPPQFLYHGTATRFLAPICTEGLWKMQRTHVHLSADVVTAAQVGGRHGNVVVIPIKTLEMHFAGHIFYKSENDVWLTDAVPVKFLDLEGLIYEPKAGSTYHAPGCSCGFCKAGFTN